MYLCWHSSKTGINSRVDHVTYWGTPGWHLHPALSSSWPAEDTWPEKGIAWLWLPASSAGAQIACAVCEGVFEDVGSLSWLNKRRLLSTSRAGGLLKQRWRRSFTDGMQSLRLICGLRPVIWLSKTTYIPSWAICTGPFFQPWTLCCILQVKNDFFRTRGSSL